MNYTEQAKNIINSAESKLYFSEVNNIALYNQSKVLEAFKNNRLSYRHFSGTNGYGYGDEGRDTLNSVFKDIFKAEAAIVSPYMSSGTNAIYLMLSSILRPNNTLMSITGKPYDTLNTVINGDNVGSLKDYSINYKQVELVDNGFDYNAIKSNLEDVNVVFITRSRGYEWRNAQSIDSIKDVIKFIKGIDSNVIIAVDNCYGEFVDTREPLEVGADIIAGSLIKNPGGGIAPSGGYIAGRKDLVELASYRLTAPGIGSEVGSYAYGYQLFYQGLFMAPTTVLNAIKCNMLMGQAFSDLGMDVLPRPNTRCHDIILSIRFYDKESLINFCRSIQFISPVDSFVQLEPWAMPGYECDVIMAAGTFVAGASIELSADSPIKEPYIAYLQGALTYEHAKLAAIHAVDNYLKYNHMKR